MSFMNLTNRVRHYVDKYRSSAPCDTRAPGDVSRSLRASAPARRSAELYYLVPRRRRPACRVAHAWVSPGDSVVLGRLVARFFFDRVDDQYQVSVDADGRDWRYAGPVSFRREAVLVSGGGPVFRIAALQLAYDGRPMRALLEVSDGD